MIKVVSFDIDGTLIDGSTDTIIWNTEIPKIYAQIHCMSLKGAEEKVFSEYYRAKYIEKIDTWTDIKYWFERLGLDGWKSILEKVKGELRPFPDVIETLESLREKYTLITTTLNTKEFLEMKLAGSGLSGFFEKNFYTGITGHDKKTITKEDETLFRKVLAEMGISAEEMAHVGDDHITDYRIPSSLGIKCYLLDRSGKEAGESVIHSLKNIINKL